MAADGLTLIATPTDALRSVVRGVDTIAANAPMVWLCKGFEQSTSQLPHQVAREELRDRANAGPLFGPSFASEVARGIPTALTVAGTNDFCELVTTALHGGALRIYSTDDVVGVEVGGAVKNVMAIATGISDALELGLNARAALITRGLAEITRFGVALGARAETFMGLTGLGDLILTRPAICRAIVKSVWRLDVAPRCKLPSLIWVMWPKGCVRRTLLWRALASSISTCRLLKPCARCSTGL